MRGSLKLILFQLHEKLLKNSMSTVLKVDFIQQPVMISSVAGLRRNFKALPKAKLAR